VRDGEVTVPDATAFGSVKLAVVADGSQGVEGGVVGIGEGVQVAFGGAEAGVAESFAHGLQVRAAGDHP
jgi:hypothetical protein